MKKIIIPLLVLLTSCSDEFIVKEKSSSNIMKRSPQVQYELTLIEKSGLYRTYLKVDMYDFNNFQIGDTVIIGRTFGRKYIVNKK